MGKYEELKEFPEKQFKRLTGVQRGEETKSRNFFSKSRKRKCDRKPKKI